MSAKVALRPVMRRRRVLLTRR